MNRRDLFRSALVGGALAVVRPASAQNPLPGQTADSREHPGAIVPDLSAADWKPVFLDNHQNETLVVLSDRIIPETDTPGANAAQVNRFIDLLLSVESRETQQSFLNSLSYIDGESRRRYGSRFVDLPPQLQNELLEFLAFPVGQSGWTRENEGGDPGHGHFENLKGAISQAFYTSEIGMKSLGWDGQVIHAPPVGCVHEPGTHGKEV
jgi:hypothetical protein